jgi:hypothetical protein
VLFEQILDGEQAVRHGLAWDCVEDDELVDAAVDYAAKAAAPSGGGWSRSRSRRCTTPPA